MKTHGSFLRTHRMWSMSDLTRLIGSADRMDWSVERQSHMLDPNREQGSLGVRYIGGEWGLGSRSLKLELEMHQGKIKIDRAWWQYCTSSSSWTLSTCWLVRYQFWLDVKLIFWTSPLRIAKWAIINPSKSHFSYLKQQKEEWYTFSYSESYYVA